MATKNLSVKNNLLPSAAEMRFGVVVSEWNGEVTTPLLDGAIRVLTRAGCDIGNITVKRVPGAFELPLGVQFFAEYTDVDAVIALGCVIRGETPHFDYVCQGATQGISQLAISWNMPVAFGLLTTDNLQQALDRAGGRLGNKGEEAAATAIRMAALQVEMEQASEKPIVSVN